MVYFVGRNPGITVSELLAILKITKQSLSRVLSHLVAEGYIVQRPGLSDRRKRMLELTAKGVELEQMLTDRQRKRFAAAYRPPAPRQCGFAGCRQNDIATATASRGQRLAAEIVVTAPCPSIPPISLWSMTINGCAICWTVF